MSDRTPEDDPLLAALRALPSRATDGPAETRLKRQARAAFVRHSRGDLEGTAWPSVATVLGRAAVPVFLAGIVGVYMTWAIATATAIVH
jgi:hypothetical protein